MSDTIKNVRLKDRTGNILHPEITVDAELNSTSENPVQNKVKIGRASCRERV